MYFTLSTQKKKRELIYIPKNIKGLDVTPKKNEKESIKIKSITLVDESLIKTYITKKIKIRINKLFNLIKEILNTDDEGTPDTFLVLDEIQRFKSIMINKYKEFLTQKQYKDFLSKIIIMEEEFKSRYNQKMLFKEYIEERNIGKSR